ncbi:MAG: ComEC/Rec2 family competence protein [Patescibacteria group bacterium]|nr:ComEC/Rec2 family competence protein [Patescibacteria group bacterium]
MFNNLFSAGKAKIFLFACLFFIAGIAVASFLLLPWLAHDLGWFIGMVFCAIILILFFRNKKIFVPAMLGLFLFLGIWRYSFSLPTNTPDKVWFYNGQEAVITGTVCNEPDIREKNAKYEICAEYLAPEGEIGQSRLLQIGGKILVTTNLYPAFSYGDELEIKCELEAPEKFNDFAYDRYLARFDIYSTCFYPEIKMIKGGGGNYFYKKIFSLKNRLHEAINYGLPEPEASLAGPLLLGYKKNISASWQEKFSQSGLSHIMAISGTNISILAALVMSLLLGLGLARRQAFWLASLFLLSYVILVGAPASAMRAGVMGFLVLWAMKLGRLNKLTNSLVLAAAILLLANPRLLRDDIGFQLSFLAVLGMVYFPPIFERLLSKFTNPQNLPKILKIIYDIFSLTLAAQIFTIPIIAFNFSQVSLIAPVSNLLVLWCLPFLTIAVLIALGLSLALPNLAWLFFLPALLVLKYIMAVVDWSAGLPYAYIEVDYLWLGWVVIYYLAMIWVIFKFRGKTRNA